MLFIHIGHTFAEGLIGSNTVSLAEKGSSFWEKVKVYNWRWVNTALPSIGLSLQGLWDSLALSLLCLSLLLSPSPSRSIIDNESTEQALSSLTGAQFQHRFTGERFWGSDLWFFVTFAFFLHFHPLSQLKIIENSCFSVVSPFDCLQHRFTHVVLTYVLLFQHLDLVLDYSSSIIMSMTLLLCTITFSELIYWRWKQT